jgi:DNA-binding CsgD family transcriptional regulator
MPQLITDQVLANLDLGNCIANDDSRSDARSSAIDLGSVWRDLLLGKCFASFTLCSDSKCIVSLVTRQAPPPPPAEENFRILERILLGEGQQSIALSLDIGVSTVAAKATGCLRYIGREHRSSRVPVLLTMAAHAARGAAFIPARATRTGSDAADSWTVSVQRPDACLATILSPAEFAVARLMVEGKSRAEMAQVRATSTRTIANQLAAVFRQLNVSGRSEILAKLVRISHPIQHDQFAVELQRRSAMAK